MRSKNSFGNLFSWFARNWFVSARSKHRMRFPLCASISSNYAPNEKNIPRPTQMSNDRIGPCVFGAQTKTRSARNKCKCRNATLYRCTVCFWLTNAPKIYLSLNNSPAVTKCSYCVECWCRYAGSGGSCFAEHRFQSEIIIKNDT